jgi:hypothetical protein
MLLIFLILSLSKDEENRAGSDLPKDSLAGDGFRGRGAA